MVETDVGNERQVGLNDVGTVQSPAKSYFDYSYVYCLFGKIKKSHDRCQFEERWMQWFEKVPMFFYELDDELLGDWCAVYPYPFAEIYQMG